MTRCFWERRRVSIKLGNWVAYWYLNNKIDSPKICHFIMTSTSLDVWDDDATGFGFRLVALWNHSHHIFSYYYYLCICTRNELTKIIMVISWCTKCKHTSFKIDEVAWHLSRLKIIFSFSPPVSTFHLNGKNKCYVISVKHTKHRAVLKKMVQFFTFLTWSTL